MKLYKKTLLILAVIFLIGCEELIKDPKSEKTILINNNFTVGVYVIDSCEYIGSEVLSVSSFLTHKGNCKFCAERNK